MQEALAAFLQLLIFCRIHDLLIGILKGPYGLVLALLDLGDRYGGTDIIIVMHGPVELVILKLDPVIRKDDLRSIGEGVLDVDDCQCISYRLSIIRSRLLKCSFEGPDSRCLLYTSDAADE